MILVWECARKGGEREREGAGNEAK